MRTQECGRLVRYAGDLVGCLPIQLSSDLGLRLIVFAFPKRLQLAPSKTSPGPGDGSDSDAQSDSRSMADGRDHAPCAQPLTALVLRGEDEYLVINPDVLAPIHRLLGEREQIGSCVRGKRGLHDKRHQAFSFTRAAREQIECI